MKTTPPHALLANELKRAFTHQWKEKFAALVLAFFFWNMLKQKIAVPEQTKQEFIQQHSVQGAAGLDQ